MSRLYFVSLNTTPIGCVVKDHTPTPQIGMKEIAARFEAIKLVRCDNVTDYIPAPLYAWCKSSLKGVS